MAKKKSISKINAGLVKILPMSNGKSEMTITGLNSKGTESLVTVILQDWDLIHIVEAAGKIARKRVTDAEYISKQILNAINPQ